MKLEGVWTALITPFTKGEIDLSRTKTLVERQLKAGVAGICPAGTTGEGSSLESDEFDRLVGTALFVADNKLKVAPGTGSNNTRHTIERTKRAKSLGAHAALVVTPYYVRPTQDGLYRHFAEVVAQADFPIILYNVPGRTAVNMLPETVERLSKDTRIVAIKDCAPLTQVAQLKVRLGDRISILSGEDGVYVPFLALGGDGIVSVVANVAPDPWVSIFEQFRAGNVQSARNEFLSFANLTELLFVEPNPVPLKAALEMMGLIEGELRSPLAPISEKNRASLRTELIKKGFLKR